MIYVDFESILKRVQRILDGPDESYTNNYHDYIGCSYWYTIICIDNRFSEPKHYGKDALYKIVSKMLEEVKYCKEIMKKHLRKNSL